MWAAASGAGLGDESFDTGISTSTVPTLYGPVYSGNVGTGLKLDTNRAMLVAKRWDLVGWF